MAEGGPMTTATTLTEQPTWLELRQQAEAIQQTTLRELFDRDPTRGERLTVEAAGLYFDYSKHRITDEILRLLVRLATERGLRERINAMFRGDKINVTEGRAVLHTALRAPRDAHVYVDGQDVVPEVHAV